MPYADLVFTGGPVHRRHRALAGPAPSPSGTGASSPSATTRCATSSGPRTEVVDLAGRLLVPGFQDAHVHPVGGGLELARVRPAPSAAPARSTSPRIAAYAAAHPDARWITGGGWSMEAFPGGTPTARASTRSSPTARSFLPNRDHHGAWVNSRALELAGITARHARPRRRPDRARRRRRARPACCTRARWTWSAGCCPPTTPAEQLARRCCGPSATCTRLGITAWQDAIVGAYGGMPDVAPRVPAPPRPTARSPPGWSAPCGGTATAGAEQIADLVARRDALTAAGRFRRDDA